jgi:glycosyltransferase involved in cell wall biosynthesis
MDAEEGYSVAARTVEESLSPRFRAEWDQLLAGESDNLYAQYQSSEWFNYLAALEPDRLQGVVELREPSGRLAGAVPLYRQSRDVSYGIRGQIFWKQRLDAVSILGSQPLVPDSERSYDAFLEYLATFQTLADGFYFHSIPTDCSFWKYLHGSVRVRKHFLVWVPEGIRSFHSLELPGTFDAFTAPFGSKKRNDLKRKVRRLRDFGGGKLEFVRVEAEDQIPSFRQAGQDVIARAWQKQSVQSQAFEVFNKPGSLESLARRGLLRSYVLIVGGRPCALVIGYQYGNTFHFAETGYDQDVAHLSPGTVLTYLLIEDLIGHRRPARLNFGIGDSRYKREFGNISGHDASVVLLRKTPRNRLRVSVHHGWLRASAWAKTALSRLDEYRSWLPVGSRQQAKSGPRCDASPAAPSATSRPVRVCFLIDQLYNAGTETQLVALIRNLDRSRVQPYLALLDGEAEYSRALEPPSCPVIRLGLKNLGNPAAIGALLGFHRFLRRERIDVLQVYFLDSTYFGVLAGRLAGVRSIVRTRNNNNYWMTLKHRILGRLINRLVTMTVCNSEAGRQGVLADERPDPESVTVIENGVDLERFAHIPTFEPNQHNGRPRRIGMVANLRPVKGIDVFLRAAARVAPECPDVTFHVAGDGPQRPELEKMIAELGLAGRCHLHGLVDDIPSFLADLDIALLSSRAEGTPNAVLEYMAAGRPIVATSVGGVASIVSHDVEGWLVPPESPESLASAVVALLNDPARASRLAGAGRQRAQLRFSRAACIARYENLYSRMLRG